MTKKEKEILEIIRENPLIEQSEIARLLDISRSTVAVHISSLQSQGYISGKGYILKEEDYIVGVGACNVDVYGRSRIPIRTHYDHPADIVSGVGGVMYNIICNYVKLGGKADLITAYSDDAYGMMITSECKRNGIDIHDSLMAKGATSGIFMQIQDENNDMYMAICDMSILENLTPAYLRSKEKTIRNARLVVMDPSLPDDVIRELIGICKDHTSLYIDPISENYALKMRPYVPDIDLIKPNRGELENLSGMKIKNDEDLFKAVDKLLEQGAKRVVVSLGSQGILYADQDRKIRKRLPEEKHMVNASGAGDALMAAIIYGDVNGLDIDKTLDYGLAAGIAAIRSNKTINSEMSVELLDKIIEEKKK
ncbi:MAG: winged helix-turn-helix transcriptional regulator [Erysipelotrichaceae bacterium]|nr:winged helix-turn-helix transcriptional regulator [Erysipelotrichaceae bacterium]